MRFAAEELETVITSEKLFEIAGLPITNSIFYGWIVATLIIIFLVLARKRIKIAGTKGPSELLEVGTEFMVNLVKNTLGSERLAIKYTPLFATMFFFILINNWLGLIPGIGHTITYGDHALLRPFTADLNGTLAMALFGIVTMQIISIREVGSKIHLKHYFPGKLYNPLTYLIGAFEIFTELTRLLSLGLRLFLNIAIGEILILVAAYLGGPAAPLAALPFTLLEIFVGVLQAFIFVVLCMAYLSATISHSDHQEEHA
jgi:F-type H+-transporting ATPase subunit a